MNKIQQDAKEWLLDQYLGTTSRLTDLACYDLEDLNYTYKEYDEAMNRTLDFLNVINYLTDLVEWDLTPDREDIGPKSTPMKLKNYKPEDMGGDCPRCGQYNERFSGELFNGTDECWNCHQSLDDMSDENEQWFIEEEYLENLKREQKEAEQYHQMFMEANEKGEL